MPDSLSIEHPMTEHQIENAVIRNVAKLGYASSVAVRNARIGENHGQADLALFPRAGRKRLILVEAKRGVAEESKSKVIGQMIMYLTGALCFSEEGVRVYREYAREHSAQALARSKTTPKMVAGTATWQDGWTVLSHGTKLQPSQVSVYLATDREPKLQLLRALDFLADHHELRIGVLRATTRGLTVVRKAG